MPRRTTSRLKRIESKKDRNQALLFILLSVGFLLLIIFLGFPLFTKAAIFLDEIRSSSESISANNDQTPPIPPRLNSDIEATSSANINFSGFSEPGSTVFLILNGDKINETITEDNGKFLFSKVTLEKGNNQIIAYSQDLAGNKSSNSSMIEVVYDNVPPILKVTSPEDNKEFYDNEREIIVAGETDIDSKVRVNGFVVVVDTEGNFVKRIQLTEGQNDIEVVAIDEAGNKTTENLSVKYYR